MEAGVVLSWNPSQGSRFGRRLLFLLVYHVVGFPVTAPWTVRKCVYCNGKTWESELWSSFSAHLSMGIRPLLRLVQHMLLCTAPARQPWNVLFLKLLTVKCIIWPQHTPHVPVSVSHPKNSYSTRSRCSSVVSVSLNGPSDGTAASSSPCASAPSLPGANKRHCAPGETSAAMTDSSDGPSQAHREVMQLSHWVRREMTPGCCVSVLVAHCVAFLSVLIPSSLY